MTTNMPLPVAKGITELEAMLREILSQDFMIRALAGGALVGIACAMLGILVFQRGMTFVGDGLAHSMFGAAGIVALLNLVDDSGAILWAALPLNVLVGFAMAWVRRAGKLRGDAAIGILFPIMFAAGVLCLSLRRSMGAAPVNMEALLFGSVLGMTPEDLVVTATGAVTITVIVLTWGRRIAYAAFDQDLAAMSGVRVALAEYALFGLCAAVVAISARFAGVVLVSSLLAIPAGAVSLWRASYGWQLFFASIFASAAVKTGLIMAYVSDAPSGAMIILTMGVFFLVSLVARFLVGNHARG